MSTVSPEFQSVLLSTRAADRPLLHAAWVAIVVTLLVALAFMPFARQPLPRSELFLPIYQTALVVCDIFTAALLFNRAAIGNSMRLHVLAGAYVFSAAMAVTHALSFPGLFAPDGLLGAGEQTTAWLYFLWHIGFAAMVLAYALTRQGDVRVDGARPRMAPMIAWTVLVAAGFAASLTAATTLGHDALPPIMRGDQDLPLKYGVAAVAAGTTLAAAVTMWRLGPSTVLNVWLMLVLAAWLCEIALAALFNAGRYSVGWYAGRVYGLIAAATLLWVFVAQDARLNRRLVEMLGGEAARRRELEEAAVQLERAEAEASQALHELRRLARHRLGAREDERKRIARDLHDDLGQSLAVLGIELEALATGLADPRALSRLESMRSIVDTALQSMRRIVAELRPPLLDALGFERGVESLLDEFCTHTRMQCRLQLDPPGLELPEPHASTVFRIVQEALTNAARHGHARRVDVEIRCDNEAVRACVRDDGQGIDATGWQRPGANGLTGMRERVHLLAGQLRIDSTPGQGTVVEACLPMDAAAPASCTRPG